jgi:hypothetical protein
MVTLINDPELAAAMGLAGRKSVSRDYLMPRLLRDYFRLASRIV